MNVYPGLLLTPTLRLREQLGRGGMGSIWIADHLALETPVAVKFMAPELVANAEIRSRFSREAAAASQVKSPHVVQMLENGVTADGVPFIAMELLAGEDLASRVRRRGLPSLHQLSAIITQAAKALARAHERGIVHRDIKPENIFLCETDDDEIFVKVLDFGIAKASDSLSSATRTGSVMGTAYYMSPEQIVGAKNIDHRTDVWALGVVAYEIMTGKKPFDGETIGALTLAIHGAALPMPSTVNRSLPRGIDEWFSKACARDMNQRFSSAKELARSFAAAVGDPALRLAEASQPGMAASNFAPLPPFGTTMGAITRSTSPNAPPQATEQTIPKSSAGVLIVLGGVALLAIGVVLFFVTRGDPPKTPPPMTSTEQEPTEDQPPQKKKTPKKTPDTTDTVPSNSTHPPLTTATAITVSPTTKPTATPTPTTSPTATSTGPTTGTTPFPTSTSTGKTLSTGPNPTAKPTSTETSEPKIF